MTAQELINRSLTLIQRLGAGRTAGVSESLAVLGVLNAMLNSWSTNRLTVYSISITVFPVTANTQSYDIGPGLTWDNPRPVKITSASVVTPTGGVPYSYPIEIIDATTWSNLPRRNDSSPIVRYLHCDYGFPTSTISLSPIPSGTPTDIELRMYVPLTQFPTVTSTATFPEGYEHAITYNLAVALGSFFPGVKASDEVVAIAKASYENIAQLNAKISGPAELADPRVVGAAQ